MLKINQRKSWDKNHCESQSGLLCQNKTTLRKKTKKQKQKAVHRSKINLQKKSKDCVNVDMCRCEYLLVYFVFCDKKVKMFRFLTSGSIDKLFK